MPRVRKKFASNRQKTRAKRWFWMIFSVISVLLIVVVLLYPAPKLHAPYRYVTVGISGCINNKAVYRLPEGSDLAMLIHSAKGFTPEADVKRVPFSLVLQNDNVYSIPCREKDLEPFFHELKREKLPEIIPVEPEEEVVNILYIGFPAVYFLIRYSISHKMINVIYIPHSTVFLANEYRIIDLYFTLGIDPTVKILESALKQRIHYYYIQNKTSFIKMIDGLGGLRINIDPHYAEEYNLNQGWNHLDGWHTYEYIRYIDRITYSSEGNTKSLEELELTVKDAGLAWDLRQHRQKKVIDAIHKIVQDKINRPGNVPDLIRASVDLGAIEANLDANAAVKLFKSVMEGATLAFGTLPGYYKNIDDNIYYIPDPPSFDMLWNIELREMVGADEKESEQILY